MTKRDYEVIMEYFNEKKMNREQLNEVLDFENLTMRKDIAKDVGKRLVDAGYKKSEKESAMRNFVRYVKSRSGSGDITWDEFVEKLKELDLEDSDFGIRVQRFSKYSYWEVFFNHFELRECEDGNMKLTFNHEYYWDSENEKAHEVLENLKIDTELEAVDVISAIANKWDDLSEDNRDNVIQALYALNATQYVDKSRMMIDSGDIEKITMSMADLVPQVGLRDYHITFVGGDSISLRF